MSPPAFSHSVLKRAARAASAAAALSGEGAFVANRLGAESVVGLAPLQAERPIPAITNARTPIVSANFRIVVAPYDVLAPEEPNVYRLC